MLKNNKVILFLSLLILLFFIEIGFRVQLSIQNLEIINRLPQIFRVNLVFYLVIISSLIPLFIAEKLIPNDTKSDDHSHGIVFLFINLQFSLFFTIIVFQIIKFLKIKPLISLNYESIISNLSFSPILINILLISFSLIIFDFFYYWLHRVQHTYPILWEFHKTHHSIRNLNTIVSYNHISESFFQAFFVLFPIAFILKIDAPQIIIFSSFVLAHGQFNHMNSKVSLGYSLRKIISDNYFHRIHHSIEKHHQNKNFSAFFTIWDIVFRSAYFPKNNEFPEAGLKNYRQPKDFKDFFFSPNISQFLKKK